MNSIYHQLLVLLIVVWTVGVLLSKIGLPTIMGELLMGIVLGPAVFGVVEPNVVIDVLAKMGIFFLLLHAGVETQPREFFPALKTAWGVAIVGAVVPFTIGTGVALSFNLPINMAIFIGLTMVATAVVVTIKTLKELGLHATRLARLIVASSMLDALFTLILFSIVMGIIQGEAFNIVEVLTIIARVIMFFGVSFLVGYYLYPKFTYPFRHKDGKGFTFVLVLSLAAGLFAESINLHIILGAYLAGLFFDETVADKALYQRVEDRLFGIGYSFLGPIFFISLGLNVTFDALTSHWIWLVIALTVCCAIGQILSAGSIARLIKFSPAESITIGVGMCGRAEMSFIMAALGLSYNIISKEVFSVLVFTAFILNIITVVGLKACAILLARESSTIKPI